jgi:LmbE family N-acetylglucosaminyl deacetylase
MPKEHWIFLSPHLDDVALSCGGLVWELSQRGKIVEIWTLMSGFPTDEDYSEFAQQNHRAWGVSGREAVRVRRSEDRAACAVLGAAYRHFDWLDAIYRRDAGSDQPLVENNESLFGKPPEDTLVSEIAQCLQAEVPKNATVVFPMGLGNHIDHRAVVQAGKDFKGTAYYYADYPYVLENFLSLTSDTPLWEKIAHAINEDALEHWQNAVLCYSSQIGAFWRDIEEMKLSLRNYLAGGGGRLWQKVEN